MRNGTKAAFSLLSLGVLALSYQQGTANAAAGNGSFNAAAMPSAAPSSSTGGTTASSNGSTAPSATPSQSSTSNGGNTGSNGGNSGNASGNSNGSGSNPQPSASSSPSASSTPTQSNSPTPTPTQSAAATVVTHNATVNYNEPHSGTLTVSLVVTKTNGKITAVDTSGSTATAGRNQAFPMLVTATLQAQGSGFGNVSSATYTTAAFKQALDAALAKF